MVWDGISTLNRDLPKMTISTGLDGYFRPGPGPGTGLGKICFSTAAGGVNCRLTNFEVVDEIDVAA